jgi:hypothetical protein
MPIPSARLPIFRAFLIVGALAIPTFAATPAFAWTHCGTPQAEADCAAHGLPGKPTPVPTPVVHRVAPAPAPVAVAPAPVAAAPIVAPAPAPAEYVGGSKLPTWCHYEPSTSNWELRHEAKAQPGDMAPNSAGLCGLGEAVSLTVDAPAAASVPAVIAASAPVVIAAAPAIETSSVVVIVAAPVAPATDVVEGQPQVVEEEAAPFVPEDLGAPATGGDGLVMDLGD